MPPFIGKIVVYEVNELRTILDFVSNFLRFETFLLSFAFNDYHFPVFSVRVGGG